MKIFSMFKGLIIFSRSTTSTRTINHSRSLSNIKTSLPEFTSIRYPDVQRGSYATLNETHISSFKNILDPNRVITDTTDLEGYNVDWLKTVRGNSKILLKPKTTDEISKVMSYCYDMNLAVNPQGGNTGLVGGSVPVFDEVILSTQLLNEIESFNDNSSVVRVQSGVVLERLDSYLSDHEMMVPLDLGAKGSCHIGGNVSTNAGGLRMLRYGSMHANVLGMEVVLAQKGGPIIDLGYQGSLKKDNTGYDLKHLFIGSEGTLGFITRVALACPPRPKAINVCFLGLHSFSRVIDTFKSAKGNLGEILSSCEFIDRDSMEAVCQNLGLVSPLGDNYPFYTIIETSGSNKAHDEEKLSNFLAHLYDNGTVIDGTYAEHPSRQSSQIWQIRERITEALLKDGYVYKYDISVPIEKFYSCVTDLKDRLGSDVVRCCGFGHLGDGNIHLNVTSRMFDKNILSKIEPYIYEWTKNVNGSISAEHGLGFKKRNYMHFSKSVHSIHFMREIKSIVDPKGIMNPYKVLPDI